jgi:alpha-D-xyloside xylohydrolase
MRIRTDNILYHDAATNSYIGNETLPDGTRGPKPYSYPEGTICWRTEDLVIDFSNPDAAKWYGSKISYLIEQGASAIKTDFGDCIPPQAHCKNISGHKFQNLYSLAYNVCIARARHAVDPDSVTAQWALSGTAGN